MLETIFIALKPIFFVFVGAFIFAWGSSSK